VFHYNPLKLPQLLASRAGPYLGGQLYGYLALETMSTTLGSSSKPIQSIRNVSPREVGSRDNDKDRDLLHARCICNYVSIDSTTTKSVRVYSIVRREIANNMYYKLTIRYRNHIIRHSLFASFAFARPFSRIVSIAFAIMITSFSSSTFLSD